MVSHAVRFAARTRPSRNPVIQSYISTIAFIISMLDPICLQQVMTGHGDLISKPAETCDKTPRVL